MSIANIFTIRFYEFFGLTVLKAIHFVAYHSLLQLKQRCVNRSNWIYLYMEERVGE